MLTIRVMTVATVFMLIACFMIGITLAVATSSRAETGFATPASHAKHVTSSAGT